MSKLTLPRALTAHVASRFLRLATLIAVAGLTAVVILCGLLAYFFSSWWWLLLAPFVFLLGLFMVIRLVIVFIVRRIHPERMSTEQRQALDHFVDKVQSLLEARATPLPVFVLLTIKDLVLYRDVTTIRKIISDTASLRNDYQSLDKLF